MNADTIAEADLTDRELALQFESVGDNCELGLVQRKVGAEPLGMFRFAGAPLGHLLAAMHARFQGMADPAFVQVHAENGEYMIKLTKYDFVYHADAKVGEADPNVLRNQQVRTVEFLVEKLIGDLENRKQNLGLSAERTVVGERSGRSPDGDSRLWTLDPALGPGGSAWPPAGQRYRCG